MGNISALDTRPDTATAVLIAARNSRATADREEAMLCQLAVEWAVMHPVESIHEPATYVLRGFGQSDLALAGEGAPRIAEYAVPEFAASVGLSTEAGKRFLGDCLELRYRLPRLWARLVAGDLVAWKARLVARETTRLTAEAAGFVDRQVAPVAHQVKPTQLDRLVNEAIGRYMPEEVERLASESWDKRHVTIHEQLVSFTGTMSVGAELDIADALDLEAAVQAGAEQRAAMGSLESLDVRRAQAIGDLARGQSCLDLTTQDNPRTPIIPSAPRVQPRQVVIYVHLSQAALQGSDLDPVARLERGDTLVGTEQVRAWCGRPETHVVVKPVIDLNTCTGSDTDHVPDRIKEHVDLRDQTCVFPWCTRPARGCDHDHTHPRSRNGPTCTCNIAPLCRTHHRLKTHTPWTYTTLDPGTYLWSSPHGYTYLRNPTGGTHDVSPDRPHPPEPPQPPEPPDT
jgi:hypothetical protein